MNSFLLGTRIYCREFLSNPSKGGPRNRGNPLPWASRHSSFPPLPCQQSLPCAPKWPAWTSHTSRRNVQSLKEMFWGHVLVYCISSLPQGDQAMGMTVEWSSPGNSPNGLFSNMWTDVTVNIVHFGQFKSMWKWGRKKSGHHQELHTIMDALGPGGFTWDVRYRRVCFIHQDDNKEGQWPNLNNTYEDWATEGTPESVSDGSQISWLRTAAGSFSVWDSQLTPQRKVSAIILEICLHNEGAWPQHSYKENHFEQ